MTTLHDASGPDLTADRLYAILRLRADVFVVEQDCPYGDLDGRDLLASTRHLWFEAPDGAVSSYLRVLADPGGILRIGRVVTAAPSRGRGLAAALMTAALDAAPGEFVLDAQTYAQSLYTRFGFAPEGKEFLEDGIPHITMRRAAVG